MTILPRRNPVSTFSTRFPGRATSWRLRSKSLPLTRLPLLMGIVNVTPDSFSDGGQHFATSAAIEHGLRLATEGADIIDVGGESTRPYATAVEEPEELRRVIPVVQELCARLDLPVSIDTSKAAVAREGVAAGAEIINDVTGLTGDPRMAAVAAELEAGVCAMHMQGNPRTMQDDPTYHDVIEEIYDFLAARRDGLREYGIAADRICLDPGIGFGKSHQHNLTLLAHCHHFHALGCPLLVGHSRKGFLAKILQNKEADRAAATAGVAAALASQGVQILRVHDVQTVKETLWGFDAAGGIDGRPLVLS